MNRYAVTITDLEADRVILAETVDEDTRERVEYALAGRDPEDEDSNETGGRG